MVIMHLYHLECDLARLPATLIQAEDSYTGMINFE